MSLDLPLIWAGIIAVAVLLYVLLDGRIPPALVGRVTMIDGVPIIAPTGSQ